MSAFVVGVLMSGAFRRMHAQAKIERYAPELDGIISDSEPIREL